MTERTVAVRLDATVNSYVAKMATATAATVAVGEAGVAASSKLAGMGKGAESVGRDLTKYVSLPIAAVGVAAAKMSIDFSDTFAKMQGLAGVAADEVEGLKNQVFDLAHATGVGPQQLAEGLYFVRSAGLAGQTAIDAMTTSAKGAAIGLGSTATVADAVTSAINAYGAANLTAAHAGDVLVATAREGKAEAAAMAPEFGRLLPIASELGVSFDQVGAGMAFLSRSSGDAALSGTQLGGVLRSLLKPGQESQKMLGTLGLTTEDVHRSLRENGLLQTLTDLRSKLGDSGFSQFFQDSRALTGALALTGVQAGEAKKVFDQLASSTGSLDDAFEVASHTAGFRTRQAWADMQTAAIKAGDILLPLIASLAESIAGLVNWFSQLPKPAQDALLIFGGFAAVLGPSISIVGKLVDGLGKMHQRLIDGAAAGKTFGDSLGRGGVAYNVGLAGAAVATGLIALDLWNSALAEGAKQNDAFIKGIDKGEFGATKFDLATASAKELEDRIAGLKRGIEATQHLQIGPTGGTGPLDALAAAFGPITTAIDLFKNADYNAQLDDLAAKLGMTAEQLERTRAAASVYATTLGISMDAALRLVAGHQELVGTTKEGASAFDTEAASIALVTDALKAQADAIKAQTDPFFAVVDALNANHDAQVKVNDAAKAATFGLAQKQTDQAQRIADAQENLAAANDRLAKSTETERAAAVRAVQTAQRALDKAYQDQADSAGDAQKAQDDLTTANYNAVKSAEDVQVALLKVASGVADGTLSIDTARQHLQDWVDQGLITQQQADDVAGRFDQVGTQASGLASTVDHLNQTGLTMPVTAPGLDAVIAQVDLLGQTWGGVNQVLDAITAKLSNIGSPGGGAKIPGTGTDIGALLNPTGHAAGGIFNQPHMGVVAEAGVAEAAIPLDGTARSWGLLRRAASIMPNAAGGYGGSSNVDRSINVAAGAVQLSTVSSDRAALRAAGTELVWGVLTGVSG